MTKRKLFLAAIAVCLVAILSLGTLAWFQYTDTVSNVFKVSTDDVTQDPDFKLDLFEHNVLADGTLGSDEVNTNTYEHIVPGDELAKDPTVRNEGQYSQWVRISITLDEFAAWETVLGAGYDFSAILNNVSADWTLDATTAGTGTLVYYKNTPLAAGESSTLFSSVTVPGAFTTANIPTEFNLDLVADAIQSDNTGNSAQDAFANYWA